MPFVAEGVALDRPFVDLHALADEMGAPPWRTPLVGTPSLRAVLLCWEPGYETVAHVHPAAEEVFQVLRGRACFTIGVEPEREVRPGELVLAMRGSRHRIRVVGDESLLMLAAVAPNADRPDETIEPA